jgi:hypothetical protein
MDVIRSLTRHRDVGYHLAEAETWLVASERGTLTTLLAYAAFELRLEIERLALELLVQIRGGQLVPDDVQAIRNFGRLEKLIYGLEGHQRTIDRKVAFSNVMLEALQAPWRVQQISLGRLHQGWQECSEYCHITWSLLADSPGQNELIEAAFVRLTEIQQFVRSVVDHGISWPRIEDPSFADLQCKYVSGDVGDAEVKEWLSQRGLWGRVTHRDGSSEFAGIPIAPRAG